MMATLIQKDWRLARVIVIAGGLLSTMPYAFQVVNTRYLHPEGIMPGVREYADGLQTASIACLGIVTLLAAAFGGSALAGERRERTDEFMAMLPVSRGRIIASKLIVALVCIVVLIVFHSAVIGATNVCVKLAQLNRLRGPEVTQSAGITAAFALLMFGVGWAMSVFLRSPAIAACVAIAVSVGVLFGGMFWGTYIAERWDRAPRTNSTEDLVLFYVCVAAALIGVTAIATSSVRYLRRVEP
jgi:ABC-type Na+ efflux pump permease subunit